MDDTALYLRIHREWVRIPAGTRTETVVRMLGQFHDVSYRTQDGEVGWLIKEAASLHELVGPGDWLETRNENGSIFDLHLVGYPEFMETYLERNEPPYHPFYENGPMTGYDKLSSTKS